MNEKIQKALKIWQLEGGIDIYLAVPNSVKDNFFDFVSIQGDKMHGIGRYYIPEEEKSDLENLDKTFKTFLRQELPKALY